jgi:hypothetical protein
MRCATLVLISLIVGCSAGPPAPPPPTDWDPKVASAALRHAETFELYSLDPTKVRPLNPEVRREDYVGDMFQKWPMLGSTAVDQLETRDALLDAIDAAVAESRFVAACFRPRHGIRVKFQGHIYDFVICFECHQCRWYIDDVEQEFIGLTGAPQKVFDSALRHASVELPPPPECIDD